MVECEGCLFLYNRHGLVRIKGKLLCKNCIRKRGKRTDKEKKQYQKEYQKRPGIKERQREYKKLYYQKNKKGGKTKNEKEKTDGRTEI